MFDASVKGESSDSSCHLNAFYFLTVLASSERNYSQIKPILNLLGLPAITSGTLRGPRSCCHWLQIISGVVDTVYAGFVPYCMMAAAKMAKWSKHCCYDSTTFQAVVWFIVLEWREYRASTELFIFLLKSLLNMLFLMTKQFRKKNLIFFVYIFFSIRVNSPMLLCVRPFLHCEMWHCVLFHW